LCDWCDHLAAVIVISHYADGTAGRDWLCQWCGAEHYPTLTVTM